MTEPPFTPRGLYRLDENNEPVECDNLFEWAREMEKRPDRHLVGQTQLMDGDIWVSTAFLGVDHQYGHHGSPILFETMVFGEPVKQMLGGKEREIREDLYMRRYATWAQAKRGHERIVRMWQRMITKAMIKAHDVSR